MMKFEHGSAKSPGRDEREQNDEEAVRRWDESKQGRNVRLLPGRWDGTNEGQYWSGRPLAGSTMDEPI